MKVYSGPAAADRLLQVFLAPLLEQMEPDLVDSWHFVRYADPDPHLRVRFHGDRNFLHADLIRKLRSELGVLRDAGIVWRSVTDTYDREVERYGGVDAMQIAEQLFAADSVAALNIATAYRGDAGADSRWLLALRGIDTLLRDFGRSPEARGDVISGLRRSFAKEFHADAGELKHQLGQRYRARRSQIERLIDSPRPVDRRLEQGFETLAERSQRIRPLAKQLSELEGMTRPVDDVLQSFIHMQCNRMLRWPSRAEEMVIYDFLGRYYESVLARQRAD